MSICYVSAFYDINRGNWSNFTRTVNKYFEHFRPYVELFKQEDEKKHKMIVFIDKKHYTKLNTLINNSHCTNIQLIQIDFDWMKLNLPIWNTLDREREIMNSQHYKNLIPHRLNFPEHKYPEYTLINHCKIDFVNYAMKHSNKDYFCWTDFGYFATENRIPKKLLSYKKFIPNKINYTLINCLTHRDNNPIFTLQNAPERIGGFFFFGDRKAIEKYQLLYHKILHMYQHQLNIADDDQALALSRFFNEQSLFCLHNLGGWHKALVYFQQN